MCILAGYYGFNVNIPFPFQAIKHLSAHLTYLRFGLFCILFGDVWVIFGNKKVVLKDSQIFVLKFLEGNFEDLMF